MSGRHKDWTRPLLKGWWTHIPRRSPSRERGSWPLSNTWFNGPINPGGKCSVLVVRVTTALTGNLTVYTFSNLMGLVTCHIRAGD